MKVAPKLKKVMEAWMRSFGSTILLMMLLSAGHIRMGHSKVPLLTGFERANGIEGASGRRAELSNLKDVVEYLDRILPGESKSKIARYYFITPAEVMSLNEREQDEVRVWGPYTQVIGTNEDWEDSRIERWFAWRGILSREVARGVISKEFARYLQGRAVSEYLGSRIAVLSVFALLLSSIVLCLRVASRARRRG